MTAAEYIYSFIASLWISKNGELLRHELPIIDGDKYIEHNG